MEEGPAHLSGGACLYPPSALQEPRYGSELASATSRAHPVRKPRPQGDLEHPWPGSGHCPRQGVGEHGRPNLQRATPAVQGIGLPVQLAD